MGKLFKRRPQAGIGNPFRLCLGADLQRRVGLWGGFRRSGKIGPFEMAHNGTIFLDEIGEMDRTLQARLLRVLEERQVMRLGSDSLIPVNIRVLAATNQDLRRLASQGTFRVDLLYRLNVLNLPMTPLRQRKVDIAYLAEYFLSRYQTEHRRRIEAIPPQISELLERYEWPGNVRELENTIERCIILSEGDYITEDLLPLNIKGAVFDMGTVLNKGGVFEADIIIPFEKLKVCGAHYAKRAFCFVEIY